jgi:putative FmdB family regulatory protein
MPLYEYRCDDCQHLNTVLVYSWSKSAAPACWHCGGSSLTRLVSRFAVHRSWGESLDWAPGGETLTDVDEDNPYSVDQFMGRIKHEMGGQVTPDFEEIRRELFTGPQLSDASEDNEGGEG